MQAKEVFALVVDQVSHAAAPQIQFVPRIRFWVMCLQVMNFAPELIVTLLMTLLVPPAVDIVSALLLACHSPERGTSSPAWLVQLSEIIACFLQPLLIGTGGENCKACWHGATVCVCMRAKTRRSM